MIIKILGQNAVLVALRVWAALSCGLYLLGYLLAENTAWSVWPFTFLPTWLGVLLIVCAASTLLPAWNRRVRVVIERIWQRLPLKGYTQPWFVILALLSMPCFWLARIQHLGWGDAQILVIGLSHPDQTVIYNWQAPLTVFLHQRLWALVAEP